MDSKLFPLLNRDLDDVLIHCSSSRASFAPSGVLRVDEFVAQVRALAELLPEGRYAINLCDNRYHFMLAFCALLIRGQTNLLPQNKSLATQAYLLDGYSNSYIIHDGCELVEAKSEGEESAKVKGNDSAEETRINAVNILDLSLPSTRCNNIPDIALDFVAAITFTSGSTGSPKPNLKTWATFVTSTQINADYMLPKTKQLLWQCATVPGQHMWGMETSILLPLMQRVCVADGRPLFPADILKLLNTLGTPKVLVTTPVHLRAMTMSGLVFPQLQRILCATAPLARELAEASEAIFDGQLLEIYGCSEVGSMAHRRSASTDTWECFGDIAIREHNHDFVASAKHLPESVVLSDRLITVAEGKFRLIGRGDDMVEVGGKRGSLQELNYILMSLPVLLDGVLVKPEGEKTVNRLSALVVLKPGAKKEELLEQFRQRIDPVFIPRPIYVVESLPRETNGKLPRENILTLLKALKSKS